MTEDRSGSSAMFRYNHKNFTIEDVERGLVVNQVTGPGHGVYAGQMSGKEWKFRFLIVRESNRAQFENNEVVDNPDYHINLQIIMNDVEGNYDLSDSPFTLAKEAALARELEFYKSDLRRVTTNGPKED
jgi:hypothetical protein